MPNSPKTQSLGPRTKSVARTIVATRRGGKSRPQTKKANRTNRKRQIRAGYVGDSAWQLIRVPQERGAREEVLRRIQDIQGVSAVDVDTLKKEFPGKSPAIIQMDGFTFRVVDFSNIITGVLRATGLANAESVPTLIKVAEEMSATVPSARDQAREKVRVRSAGAAENVLAKEGGAVSGDELGERLGVTRGTIHNYRKAGRIMAIPRGASRFLYPVWQVHDKGLLPGLSEVLRALDHDQSPLSKVLFFVTHMEALAGSSPLELLRRDGVKALDRVIPLAEAHGQW